MFVSVPKGDAIFMKVRFISLFLKRKFSGNTPQALLLFSLLYFVSRQVQKVVAN